MKLLNVIINLMCGIFGINSLPSHKESLEIFKKLGTLSESRGREASGWSVFNKRNIEISKSPFPFSNKKNIKELNIKNHKVNEFDWLLGHTRLVTHGESSNFINNQPCQINNNILIHNGIVSNFNDLIEKYKFKITSELDSYVILELLNFFSDDKKNVISNVISSSIEQLKGEISIAGYLEKFDKFFLYSNTGSIYYVTFENKVILFSSELWISMKADNNLRVESEVNKLENNQCLIFNREGEILEELSIEAKGTEKKYINLDLIKNNIEKTISIPVLKRCKKCILPESVPYINFDKEGICNYCKNYKNHEYKKVEELKNLIDGKKLICGFSGGRDSSYGLLEIKNRFNSELIATTYDWGMVTELARRNQARVVGKLGIEHLWISADILKKRTNIKKNLNAWLKKPHPGMIPLLMAGDKVWQSELRKTKIKTNSDFILQFECPYEQTFFKYGFANVKPNFQKKESYSLSISIFEKIKLALFYFKQFCFNPGYINLSIIDSIKGFYSFYFTKVNYIFPFNYIVFDENHINNTLEENFQWEFDSSTISSWRIGDGTAPFYNYLYYKYAGFTENDFFRSNLIREELIDRDLALKLVNIENQPRILRIKEYLDYVGIDFDYVETKLESFFQNSLVKEWQSITVRL